MSTTILSRAPEFTDAILVTANGFGVDMNPKLLGELRSVLNSDLLYSFVGSATGTLSGFAAFDVWGNILYLHGIILHESVRGDGLAKRCVQKAQSDSNADFIALRTQSSIMWASIRRLCREWLPSPGGIIPSSILRDIIFIAEEKTGTKFPVHPQGFGRPLYGKKPIHHDAEIQAWWDKLCNFEAGDSVLCVGAF